MRLVAGFVMAMVTSWSTLAWAIPCCGHRDACADESAAIGAAESADGHDGEDAAGRGGERAPAEEPCSCPPGCGPCCGAVPAPAVLPIEMPPLPSVSAWIDLVPPDLTQTPPDEAFDDILHVPRSAVASMG